MGRYVTPAGVVIEMADKAALAVGYAAESRNESAAVADEAETPKPKRSPRRPKKSES